MSDDPITIARLRCVIGHLNDEIGRLRASLAEIERLRAELTVFSTALAKAEDETAALRRMLDRYWVIVTESRGPDAL